MNEKIEEIRKRHVKALQTPSDWWTVMGDDANRDRHTLLAEVERLRAEIERLRAALESIRIDGPDVVGLVWVSFVGSEEAARGHVAVGEENCLASRAALTFEEIRRKALEGKP